MNPGNDEQTPSAVVLAYRNSSEAIARWNAELHKTFGDKVSAARATEARKGKQGSPLNRAYINAINMTNTWQELIE